MTDDTIVTTEGRVRAYAPGDEAGIQELFMAVFGRERSAEEWQWRFRRVPSGISVIVVAERGGKILGHFSNVGFPTFAHGDGPFCVGLGGDTMVHPEARGEGLMRRLIEGFLAMDHGFHARMGFPTDQVAVLMPRYSGGRYVGRFPQWVRAASPRAAARRAGGLLKPAAWLGTALGRLAAWVPSSVGVRSADGVTAEYDQLARESASFAAFIRVRDASYVAWRWLEQPGGRWTLLEARDGARLRGWAAYGMDPQEPSLGRIVDLLASDASATRALLIHAAGALEAAGADRVTLDLNDPRPWAARACMLAGFVKFGTGLNVVTRSLSTAVDESVGDLDGWYLTRGDSDLV